MLALTETISRGILEAVNILEAGKVEETYFPLEQEKCSHVHTLILAQ